MMVHRVVRASMVYGAQPKNPDQQISQKKALLYIATHIQQSITVDSRSAILVEVVNDSVGEHNQTESMPVLLTNTSL